MCNTTVINHNIRQHRTCLGARVCLQFSWRQTCSRACQPDPKCPHNRLVAALLHVPFNRQLLLLQVDWRGTLVLDLARINMMFERCANYIEPQTFQPLCKTQVQYIIVDKMSVPTRHKYCLHNKLLQHTVACHSTSHHNTAQRYQRYLIGHQHDFVASRAQ